MFSNCLQEISHYKNGVLSGSGSGKFVLGSSKSHKIKLKTFYAWDWNRNHEMEPNWMREVKGQSDLNRCPFNLLIWGTKYTSRNLLKKKYSKSALMKMSWLFIALYESASFTHLMNLLKFGGNLLHRSNDLKFVQDIIFGKKDLGFKMDFHRPAKSWILEVIF